MEAEPKSPSLTCPGSVSKMLPAFTSLWKDKWYKENEKQFDTVRSTVAQHLCTYITA